MYIYSFFLLYGLLMVIYIYNVSIYNVSIYIYGEYSPIMDMGDV